MLTGAALLWVARVQAAELGEVDDPVSVDVHAFVSQGFILTNRNNWLAKSSSGSLQFSEAGLNVTKNVTDKLRVGMQLFGRKLGDSGSYSASLDWFYLDYRFADWLGLRAGRVKIPFGLYNTIADVDSARNPVLLPQSVYPIENRDYLLAQTGVELYGAIRSLNAGALSYRIYAGTIILNTTGTTSSPLRATELNVPFLVGGRLLWELPLEGLRIGGSLQSLRVDTTVATSDKTAEVKIPATLWVGSVEYAAHDLLFAAEYSRWYVSARSSDTTVFPNVSTSISERAYAMVNYRVSTWFQPGVYYSLFFPDVDKRSGRDNVQHDTALTLRYDLDTNWILKLEGHYMVGTASLNPAINDNAPRTALDRQWGVFIAKTTAYF